MVRPVEGQEGEPEPSLGGDGELPSRNGLDASSMSREPAGTQAAQAASKAAGPGAPAATAASKAPQLRRVSKVWRSFCLSFIIPSIARQGAWHAARSNPSHELALNLLASEHGRTLTKGCFPHSRSFQLSDRYVPESKQAAYCSTVPSLQDRL